MADFNITTRRFAFLAQLDGAFGDLRGFVTDALKVDHRLGDADDQAQVGRRRLTTGENAQAFFVDGGFHLVDLFVDLAHLLGQARVGIDQRGHRIVDLLLDQTAHRQQVATDFLQFGIELGGDVMGEAVFVDHVKILDRVLSPPRPQARSRRKGSARSTLSLTLPPAGERTG